MVSATLPAEKISSQGLNNVPNRPDSGHHLQHKQGKKREFLVKGRRCMTAVSVQTLVSVWTGFGGGK